MLEFFKGNKKLKCIWRTIPGYVFWTIWSERNLRCFEGKAISIKMLKFKCLSNLATWCNFVEMYDEGKLVDFIDSPQN